MCVYMFKNYGYEFHTVVQDVQIARKSNTLASFWSLSWDTTLSMRNFAAGALLTTGPSDPVSSAEDCWSTWLIADGFPIICSYIYKLFIHIHPTIRLSYDGSMVYGQWSIMDPYRLLPYPLRPRQWYASWAHIDDLELTDGGNHWRRSSGPFRGCRCWQKGEQALLSEDEFHVGIYQSSVPQFVISRFGFHSLYMFFHGSATSGRSRFWVGTLMIWGLGRLKSLRVFPCASVDVMFQVIHSSLHGSASISSP